MTDMYLEVYRSWVDQLRGFPKKDLDRLVEPGHIVLRYADGQTVDSRVSKAMARYNDLIYDKIRKSPPETPQLGILDVESGTMTWTGG